MIGEKPILIDMCKNIDCKFYTDLRIYQDASGQSWHMTVLTTHCFLCKHRTLHDLYKPTTDDRKIT